MKPPRILPSDHGRIRQILIQCTADSKTPAAGILKAHKILLGTLVKFGAQDLKILLISQKDFDLPVAITEHLDGDAVHDFFVGAEAISPAYWDELQRFLEDEAAEIGKHIQILNPDFDMGRYIREWTGSGMVSATGSGDANEFFSFIQDPNLVMRASGNMPILLEPYYAWSRGRFGNPGSGTPGRGLILSKFIPEILSSLAGVLQQATPWFFQGGNILASKRFALVGEDILRKNLDEYKGVLLPAEEADAIVEFNKRFAGTLGVEQVIYPGLDLALLTPETVQPSALYHLDMWLTLCGSAADRRPLVLVAEIYHDPTKQGDWTPLVQNATDEQRYLQDAFDRLDAFSEHGLRFDVQRLPMLQLADGKFLSYNNCIVEIDGDTKQVFMPVFADYLDLSDLIADQERLKKADKIAEDVFEGLGFTPIPVDWGARYLANEKAGLHCKVLVLQRS